VSLLGGRSGGGGRRGRGGFGRLFGRGGGGLGRRNGQGAVGGGRGASGAGGHLGGRAARRFFRRLRRHRAALGGDPGGELGLRHDVDLDRHEGVIDAAQL